MKVTAARSLLLLGWLAGRGILGATTTTTSTRHLTLLPNPTPAQQQPQLLEEAFRKRRRHLNTVAAVASANVVINIFRPDAYISWEVRNEETII
jgi:hypothetical protein